MAFWGVEVKPAKPFTHKFDDSKGRLHVSMASLGLGSANAVNKSVLQCNIGNKSPIFLCSLYPEKSESLQLNLEYEEVDQEVVFSVIGPRSIHLSGYFLGGGGARCRHLNEESESYGEDIADTDTQRSDNTDEDEYEDSFINDDDPETFSPSPLSSDREENLNDKKRRHGKGNRKRRLRKTYQVSESSDDDDSCPISSYFKTGASTKKCLLNGGENADEGFDKTSNKNANNYGNCNSESKPKTDDLVVDDQPKRQSDPSVDPMPHFETDNRKVGTPQKKRKERNEKDMSKGDKTQLSEAKADVEIKAEDGQVPDLADDTELTQENDERPKKKKRKGLKIEEKTFDVRNSHSENDAKENQVRQDDATIEDSKSAEKKVKKKKKKNSEEVRENGEAVNLEMPQLQIEENNTCSMATESAITSQAQALQDGLVIEVLELGKPGGKVAVSGKKVSLRYVGKLKKTGVVIDSNVDRDLFKFRLGSGKVIDGWEFGVEGMLVGEKRRFTIPPSMGYGSEGDGKNVPPDSWLIYEVELVKVG